MTRYQCLTTDIFISGEFSLIPVRKEDRFEIMKMRNEQIFHLRQSEVLTAEKQDHYFNTIVAELVKAEKPSQLLFSFLKSGEFIGYGGLVHINWTDKNAEVSFIMKTELQGQYFENYWITYLNILEKIAFEELCLHKIYTYAFDLRPHLYRAIEKASFKEEARLHQHCYYDDKFVDVVIHSKFNEYGNV